MLVKSVMCIIKGQKDDISFLVFDAICFAETSDEMIYQRQDDLEKKAQFNFNIHIMIQTSCTILNTAQLGLPHI